MDPMGLVSNGKLRILHKQSYARTLFLFKAWSWPFVNYSANVFTEIFPSQRDVLTCSCLWMPISVCNISVDEIKLRLTPIRKEHFPNSNPDPVPEYKHWKQTPKISLTIVWFLEICWQLSLTINVWILKKKLWIQTNPDTQHWHWNYTCTVVHIVPP